MVYTFNCSTTTITRAPLAATLQFLFRAQTPSERRQVCLLAVALCDSWSDLEGDAASWQRVVGIVAQTLGVTWPLSCLDAQSVACALTRLQMDHPDNFVQSHTVLPEGLRCAALEVENDLSPPPGVNGNIAITSCCEILMTIEAFQETLMFICGNENLRHSTIPEEVKDFSRAIFALWEHLAGDVNSWQRYASVLDQRRNTLDNMFDFPTWAAKTWHFLEATWSLKDSSCKDDTSRRSRRPAA